MAVKSYAAFAATTPLAPLDISRREVRDEDVKIDILYCGVCHSDIHVARNEWHGTTYPIVPGHEIIGRVIEIGNAVTKYKIGDLVGVGCLVDSCETCDSCKEGLENYCENGSTGTYNSPDKISGGLTYGGYSENIVVKESFVVKIPENIDIKGAAPLLCAGITTWSPLKKWNVKKGDKVGIIGLGGLGHMGVKFAHAMGAETYMITTSPEKGTDAIQLGADGVIISKDDAVMASHANSFDFLLNTIPVGHDPNPYIKLLKRDATMVFVGALEPLNELNARLLVGKRKNVAGSMIGGIPETQEMLDFCGEHNITSDVEVIGIEAINEAYDRVVKADVKYRFVIDMQTLKTSK